MKAAQPSLFGGPEKPVAIAVSSKLKASDAAAKKFAAGVHPASEYALADDGQTCATCTQLSRRGAKTICATKSRPCEPSWPACILRNPTDRNETCQR